MATSFRLLGRNWNDTLAQLVASVKTELLVSSPYVTQEGVDLVTENLSPGTRSEARLRFLTDLSPLNICQGSTDPRALQSITEAVSNVHISHLPRLHAKVYVADSDRAIVTSGNLTNAGLLLNYEYGLEITDHTLVEAIQQDIAAYSGLGAAILPQRLAAYCQIVDRVRATYRRQQATVVKSVRQAFNEAFRLAEDELIRLRLAGGALHTVFAKTILYLLQCHGPLSTIQLHPMIEAIHPDLCDNSVDRIIDGKRFGKRWKHAVRTAQQQLKKHGLVRLVGDRWMIAK
ncbi:MAG: phospholipase D-like domain-containing protein [Candidatus Omnitrophota bacterium]|nr:phospholipase D-like domain-containing protein [Candidatus Omnitrophota bacterium]